MKRLISLVLVSALSFFSFMVYAEDEFPVTDYYLSDVALASFPSDNLGFLPSPLLGTLNLSAGEGIGTLGYAMLNPGSSQTPTSLSRKGLSFLSDIRHRQEAA